MSLEDAEVTAESMALRQVVRDVSAGLIVLLPSMDAECREQQTLRLLYWMYLDIWMKFRYVSAMRLMEK